MSPWPAVDVVVAFNDAINAQDLPALTALMTEGHRFVDATGGRVEGRAACVDAWRGFFAAYPDYRNLFDRFESHGGGRVEVHGRSTCSVPELDGPARWDVLVTDGLVDEWRVSDEVTDRR